MGSGHGHAHGPSGHAGATHRWRLRVAFVLVAAFFVVELVAGLVGGSLALLSDAGHMAADVVALALDAAPSLARRKSAGYSRAGAVTGDPPSPLNLPRGCAFASRCPRAQTRCTDEKPALRPLGGAKVACHFPLEG